MTDADSRPPAVDSSASVDTSRAEDRFLESRGSGEDGSYRRGDTPATSTRPPSRRRVNSSLRSLIEWVAVAVGALAVALLIKAFLFQAFFIPSASMHDTLAVDDRVLVNKLSYVLGEVDRGDIIVFDRPQQAGGPIDDFIKRVVALPGETISFVDGDVFIDGQRLREPYVDGAATNHRRISIDAEGCLNQPAPDTCTVAEGYFFMMGDNRPNSTDSRDFGPIPKDSIVGRAFLKVWPLGDIGFL
ncbi:MAG: signal peptidase I [Acidimicrobiales bacterium]|nr:signal peptidase I [Acidimicrobiales bacterium]MDG1877938.1 signal peptidase I [Acidimicrobiales bacterium]